MPGGERGANRMFGCPDQVPVANCDRPTVLAGAHRGAIVALRKFLNRPGANERNEVNQLARRRLRKARATLELPPRPV